MAPPFPQKLGHESEAVDEVDMLVPGNDVASRSRAARADARGDYEQDGDGSLAQRAAGEAKKLLSARSAGLCTVILLICIVALGMELHAGQYFWGRKKNNDDQPPAGAGAFGIVERTSGSIPIVGPPGTLGFSELKCRPIPVPGEHVKLHQEPGEMKCTPLKVDFDGDETKQYVSNVKYCNGGLKGAEPGHWLHFYHEAIVAYAVLHPVRARANESIFLDIGANAGIFSVIAASEGFEVYSFEPQPMCADNVLYVKQYNHIRRWKVFNIGVGCRTDKLMVFGKECGMNWQNDPYTGPSFPRNYEVPQIPLSSFKIGHGTAPPFFKVDTDGGELEIAKAILDLQRNGKFPQLPEMYFEMNPGYWPKLNGCPPCSPCLGEAEGAGANGCWGRLLNEGEQVFTELGKLYNEIYLMGVRDGPCESQTGVNELLELHTTVSRSRGQFLYRVKDFPALLKICIHLKIEHLGEGQLNVWFAA